MNSLLIQTKDNHCRPLSDGERPHLDHLRRLAEPTISQLSRDEHLGLLIFPQDLSAYGDNIGHAHILEVTDGQRLQTGNIMGFVGMGNTKVRIRSRFAQDDGRDYFLHYMLQRVFAVNLFDLPYHSDTESVFDFLLYLFPAFLKRAMRQGLYKEYQTRRYNDANVRGRIDVSRHIRQNIPFAGRIAYTTREYAYDNHITELIRHTIEYIAHHPYGSTILKNDEGTVETVRQIVSATPAYSHNDRQRIIHQNLRPLHHPYFQEYRPLQQLCLQILRHEELKYGRNDDEIYGILFDGAWLWEEYLNTFLKDAGFVHPKNKVNNVGKYMFQPMHVLLQPDFYIEGQVVLDAKYKGHDTLFGSSQREDRFQLLAYMYIFKANKSGLIVPCHVNESHFLRGDLQGYGGEMCLLGIPVNQSCSNFTAYVDRMISEEQQALTRIRTYLSGMQMP